MNIPLATAPRAIFAHSMWRTGSTYLASRFARSGRYMVFYEPDHEYVGSERLINQARSVQQAKLHALRHPDIGGGYFDSYTERDPLTGHTLSSLYPHSSCLRDVYNAVSPRMIAYLEACIRVADARGRTAFFGFCRSGTQQTLLYRQLGGLHLYLWRDPREQFQSYDWPGNDYFLPGTILQLLLSKRLSRAVDRLTAGAIPASLAALVRALPDRAYRSRYRLGRRLVQRLTPEARYALFYLSWCESRRAGEIAANLCFSLSDLVADPRRAASIAHLLDIEFDELAPTPRSDRDNLAYPAIEEEVRLQLRR